jgi:2-polyprenyl-6-methoxyphenol hydroxylase-like FAD-dependent oxidoreductase
MTDTAGGSQTDVDVLIVGAGPTGLTLACDLARRGVTARVVDKGSEPFQGSRGKGLQPRTLEVFEDLGVLSAVLAAGGEYPRLRVHTRWFSFPWDMQDRKKRTADVPYPNVWLLPQSRTEGILRARLAELGGAVERGTELTGFEQGEEQVTATLTCAGSVSRVRARYLLGADGGHSVVRKTLGVALEGGPIEGVCAIAGDLRADGLDRRFWHVWPTAKWGPVALCPWPHSDLFQLFAGIPDGAADRALTEGSVRALVGEAIGRPTFHLHDPTWLSIHRPSARLVDRYRVGRVLLAGDAAHVHPPTGGQGLNTSVQDAYNLGWKLAAVLGGAPGALLDTYEEERRPVAAGVLGLSTALLGRKWQRRGDDTKQLRTNYRGGPLASSLGARPGQVRAGDRAPDAVGTGEKGEPLRLFELLRGPETSVLAFGDGASRAAKAACAGRGVKVIHVGEPGGRGGPDTLVDAGRQVRRIYDVGEGALVLIRPDGYVGLVAAASSAQEIGAYLDRIGCC